MPAGTILIADDDSAIRTVLNQALGRAGYDVRTTGTAAGLWRWVAAGDGNLVITDVVLPDENGFDLIPRIKRIRPDLPVILVTGLEPPPDLSRSRYAALRAVVSKPIDFVQLSHRLREFLDKPSHPKPDES